MDNNSKEQAEEKKAEEKLKKKSWKNEPSLDSSLNPSELQLNKQTLDILVANVIPTTKYFESSFNHLQFQINRINLDLNEFKKDVGNRFDSMQADMDKRFDKVDQRFDNIQADMDKRFDKVDQRFSAVDKRFDSIQADMDKRFDKIDQRFIMVDQKFDMVIASINNLGNTLIDKIDGRDERQRNFTLRMFTISISISIIGVLGAFLKSMGFF